MDTPTETRDPRWRVEPYDPADAAPGGGEHRGRFPGVDMYAGDCTGAEPDEWDTDVELAGYVAVVPVDDEAERDPCECDHDIVDHPTELDVGGAHAPVWDAERNPGPCVVAGCGCVGFTRPLSDEVREFEAEGDGVPREGIPVALGEVGELTVTEEEADRG